MTRLVLAIGLLAACASPSERRGAVSVHVDPAPGGPPVQGGHAVFADPGGDVRDVPLDDAGDADGELADDGNVAVVLRGAKFAVYMYAAVHVPADLVFGVPAAPKARVWYDGELPAPTDILVYGSPCGSGMAAPGQPLLLDPTCPAPADLVVVPCHYYSMWPPDPGPVHVDHCTDEPGYQHLMISPGEGVHFALPDTWRAFDVGVLDLTGWEYVSHSLTVESAWGIPAQVNNDGSEHIAWRLPAIGPIAVRGIVRSVTNGTLFGSGQCIYARTGIDGDALNLHDVIAPWVVYNDDGWMTDDYGGALEGTARVLRYHTNNGFFEAYMRPFDAGTLLLRNLPQELYDLLDLANTPNAASFGELRIEGVDGDPQRAANILLSGGDPGATSYALTADFQPPF